VFDTLHHSVNNSGKPLPLILSAITKTWKNCDGIPMVDYSQQKRGGTRGQHAESMNVKNFTYFLNQSKPYDFDIMLEIKDKEKSATAAINIARRDHRFVTIP
jgi:UV DNA damage endonuclease